MAGSPRWTTWRSEALFWLKEYFQAADPAFALKSKQCAYPVEQKRWRCKQNLDPEEALWLKEEATRKCASLWTSTSPAAIGTDPSSPVLPAQAVTEVHEGPEASKTGIKINEAISLRRWLESDDHAGLHGERLDAALAAVEGQLVESIAELRSLHVRGRLARLFGSGGLGREIHRAVEAALLRV